MDQVKYLDFSLPDFTRIAWVSERAKSVWKPRIFRIQQAFHHISWISVAAGIRKCALLNVEPEDLVAQSLYWSDHDLIGLPVSRHAHSVSVYSNDVREAVADEPFSYRLIVGRDGDVKRAYAALSQGDQDALGRLLGYPACCRRFFQEQWVNHEKLDTTWAMACNSHVIESDDGVRTVGGNDRASILWRWMGVRAVPHLPCSFECKETAAFGEQLMNLGEEVGYRDEVGWIDEILSWPVQWSGLHGIAEIKNPLARIATRTDATANEYKFRREGVSLPDESPTGVDFPYSTKSRLSGMKPSNPENIKSESWYFKDNGFSSLESMVREHSILVRAAKPALAKLKSCKVLDLGCGNGALLDRLATELGDRSILDPYGIDSDPRKCLHARWLWPNFADQFINIDISTFTKHPTLGQATFDLVFLMPGRLMELPEKTAEKIRSFLRERCTLIVAYAYSDWLDRHGDICRLCSNAGLRLENIGSADVGETFTLIEGAAA